MVFLAITPEGLVESIRIAAGQAAVWCGSDAITEAEFNTLKEKNITRFTYSLRDADEETIARAVATIEEHHPGQHIWVEHV
jgi:hypothetical protein